MVPFYKFYLSVLFFSFFSCANQNVVPSLNQESKFWVFQFSDLPIPRGMNLLSRNFLSWSYKQRKFRSSHLIYIGKIDFQKVCQFFLDRYPIHGWKLEEKKYLGEETVEFTWKKLYSSQVINILKLKIAPDGRKYKVTSDLKTFRAKI